MAGSLFDAYFEIRDIIAGKVQPRVGLFLPHELWEKIFGFLTPHDITNTRLVSRYWATGSTPHLFRNFEIKEDKPSAEKLLFVASNKCLRRQIKSIKLPSLVIDFSKALFRILSELSEYSEHSDWGDLDVQEVFDFYRPDIRICKKWLQQRSCYKSIWDIGILDSIFASLTKLERLDFGSLYDIERDKMDLRSRETEWMDPNDDAATPDNDYERIRRFYLLLKALKDNNTRVHRLNIHDLTPWFFEQKPLLLRKLQGALRSVKALQLTTNQNRTRDNALFHKNFGIFCQLAPEIDCLVIGMLIDEFDMFDEEGIIEAQMVNKLFSIAQSFGTFQWANLKTFCLTETIVKVKELQDFLSRHARTLRAVTFCRVALMQGSWGELLRFLKASLNLSHFNIKAGWMERAVVDPYNGRIARFDISGELGVIQNDPPFRRRYRVRLWVLRRGPWPLTKKEDATDNNKQFSQPWPASETVTIGDDYGDNVEDIIPLNEEGEPVDGALEERVVSDVNGWGEQVDVDYDW